MSIKNIIAFVKKTTKPKEKVLILKKEEAKEVKEGTKQESTSSMTRETK